MMNRTNLLAAALSTAVAAMASPGVEAKPRHLSQLKVHLMSKAAKCTSCHAKADGAELNIYGKKLSEISAGKPLADRLMELEGRRRKRGSDENTLEPDQDVDADGVPNWVEILAKTNPAKKGSKPSEKMVERVERVVSCAICHESTSQGVRGVGANPHNELGVLLTKTFVLKKGQQPPKQEQAIHNAAEATPILTRLAKVKTKKAKGSKTTFWTKIRTLHLPTDPADKTTKAELSSLKKETAQLKRKGKARGDLGMECAAHKLEGFLLDGSGLD